MSPFQRKHPDDLGAREDARAAVADADVLIGTLARIIEGQDPRIATLAVGSLFHMALHDALAVQGVDPDDADSYNHMRDLMLTAGREYSEALTAKLAERKQ